jgi:elongation factor P
MNDVRVGSLVKISGAPYLCLWSDFMRTAQRKPVRRTKLKNLITGNILEQTFKPGDKIEEADVERVKSTYLFSDDRHATFMDAETFDQFPIEIESLGEGKNFLKDGLEYTLVKFEGNPITVELPKKVELQVTETVDAIRGDTAQGGVMKEAKMETGFELKVPLFIKQGDTIRINTDTGEYVERV